MQNWKGSKRLALGLGSFGIYVGAFIALYPALGTVMAALSAIPVGFFGWLFGLRFGLIGAIATVVVNSCLLLFLPGAGGMPVIIRSVPGSILILMLGALSGRLSDLVNQVHEQSRALQHEQEVLSQEIAERRRAQLALQESEARLRLIYSQIPAVLWTTDRELRFTSITGVGHLGVEVDSDLLIGVGLADVLPEEPWRSRSVSGHLQALSGSPTAYEMEYGNTLFYSQVEPFHDVDGSIIGCLGVALDITERKQLEREREELIANLQAAIASVKTLSGLLPICSCCKKIRDDRGYWNQIETYIREHSQVSFTHALCPECTRQQYPDLYDDDSDPVDSLDPVLLLPLELNQRAELIGSALSSWLRSRQADKKALMQYLGCNSETLEQLSKVPRPRRGRYHDVDTELIAVSFGIDPHTLKQLLAEVEQVEGG